MEAQEKNGGGGDLLLSGVSLFSPLQFAPLTPLSGFQGLSELEEVPVLENGPTVASTANETNK